MNVAAAVVRNKVGRSMMRAKPTQTTMKRTAPTSPMMRAASRAKMTTEMVMTMKRPRGNPVRAIWDAMNDYKPMSVSEAKTGKKREDKVLPPAWASRLQIWRSWPQARSASLVGIYYQAMLNPDSACQ